MTLIYKKNNVISIIIILKLITRTIKNKNSILRTMLEDTIMGGNLNTNIAVEDKLSIDNDIILFKMGIYDWFSKSCYLI